MLTQEVLKTLFDYDSESGLLIWKPRNRDFFKTDAGFKMWNRRYPGTMAGTVHQKKGHLTKYKKVTLKISPDTKKKTYEYHRVVFLLVNGYLPDQVDHIDGDGLNNRIDNLRAVDASENRANMSRPVTNKTGRIGVCYLKSRDVFNASIKKDGVYRNLGNFKKFEDACEARAKAESELGFHANHGRASK